MSNREKTPYILTYGFLFSQTVPNTNFLEDFPKKHKVNFLYIPTEILIVIFLTVFIYNEISNLQAISSQT